MQQIKDEPYEPMKEVSCEADSFTPENESKISKASAQRFKEERAEPEAPKELENQET